MYRTRLALILATILAVACDEGVDSFADEGDARARVDQQDRFGDAGADDAGELGGDAGELEQPDAAGPSKPDAAAEVVYLSRVYKEVFDSDTGFCSGCHPSDFAEQRAILIDFTYAWTFRDTVLYDRGIKCNGKPYVTPGNLDQSFLWDVLTKQDPGCGVEKMPQGFDTLTKEQLGLVRTWIEQGART